MSDKSSAVALQLPVDMDPVDSVDVIDVSVGLLLGNESVPPRDTV